MAKDSKNILGLDLGTNSIGWALIEQNFDLNEGKILGSGSRIIPMSQDILGDFGKGNSISQTAERTKFRSMRRLRERNLLRRERLHRVLNILGFLPKHYAEKIDFEKHFGKFLPDTEPKIAYKPQFIEGKYKYEFIFKKSFEEMVGQFSDYSKNIPFDWTIYFLRKKALTSKIEKEELAWLILNFNQKRGYYQLRGEENDEPVNKLIEFHSLKIIDVVKEDDKNSKQEQWYSLKLENGWTYKRSSKVPLFDWKDKIKDFIVTTDLNDDHSVKKDKDGNEKRSFRAPLEDDWTLQKKKTEDELLKSQKTVGSFIYDKLLQNPGLKIKGKLIRTIERSFYKNELKEILNKQREFHKELQNPQLLKDCIYELYPNNEHHQNNLFSKDFTHLFIEDIIFYQRPLKSQKNTISQCPLEFRTYKDENGNQIKKHLTAVPKSNPYFQEFRLWQWISNLVIYKKDEEIECNKDLLNDISTKEKLFTFLTTKKEIEQKTLLKFLLELKGLKGKNLSTEIDNYRWNYVIDKKYPCNETYSLINQRLEKVNNCPSDFLNFKTLYELWHIIYSVRDKIEYEKALKSFSAKYALDSETFIASFKKFPPFSSNYGSYSEKAIKKLLPLMRLGHYWDWNSINAKVKIHIEKLITGEFDNEIKNLVREKTIDLKTESDFQGLPTWLAQYIVYGRHSEAKNAAKWETVNQLEEFISEFKQHSLRNPIVEQVITETLRLVKDIWMKYGNGTKDYFNEIHIELGREMKNTADQRKRMTTQNTENENTNLRIKSLLIELMNDENIENVRPYSPMQQEILKLYEESVLNSSETIDEDILRISKSAQPSSNDLKKYKLWLEQKYRSPYTGQIIPLAKLFTPAFEIEHIIPQSRFFDDSLSNKIICEASVNKLKDNQLAFEFIRNHRGEIVETGLGLKVTIFNEEEYIDFIKTNYTKNKLKKEKLLLEDIPVKMIERQINDTRYISKYISSVLSNIVRSDINDSGVNSKNLIQCNGKITSELKNDWGLNDVWNDLILPRFERMNQLSKTDNFTTWNENHQKYLPVVPLEFQKGFSKKRIDHRHHALDAIVIACATKDHINLLNNQYAKSEFRYDLSRKLRRFEKTKYLNQRTGESIERDVPKEFIKPWKNFTSDVKNALELIIVSFKQNVRVINKTINYYQKWSEKGGLKIKEFFKQTKGDNWAVRKSMHKDTVSGLVKLRKTKFISLNNSLSIIDEIKNRDLRSEIKSMLKNGLNRKQIFKHFKDLNYQFKNQDFSKVEIYYWDEDNVASRVPLDTSFNEDKIKEKITDSGIQLILLNHLKKYENIKDSGEKLIEPNLLAFSPEGIEDMNRKIKEYNNGKNHQPIVKLRTYEPKGNKFNVGYSGNKRNKYVEAAKGTNLFFAIYINKKGERNFETIPLNIVIERQKQGLSPVPEANLNNEKLLFYLSPNDLVIIENEDNKLPYSFTSDFECNQRLLSNIYKVVSFTGSRLYAIPYFVSKPILDKVEYTQLNKMETTVNKESIKDLCMKIKVNRLGDITSFKK